MKKEKGFTLVELLIVVAIIGILAAIAIPQFNKYKVRGYVASLRSDLKNAFTSSSAYLSEYPNSTVASSEHLKAGGWKMTSGVTFVKADLKTSQGSVVLKHKQLDSNNTTNVTDMNDGEGKVVSDGTISVPTVK